MNDQENKRVKELSLEELHSEIYHLFYEQVDFSVKVYFAN
jgi:hypothetical protein